jgi:hypothetical protein
MAEMFNAFRRINVGSVALGSALLIAPKELRKQAFWYGNVTKFTKRYDDAVLGVAVGLVGIVTGQELLERGLVWGLAFAINDVYEDMVAKTPFVYVTASQIEGWNFDANAPIELYIDGQKVTATITTDANGHFTYAPSTALASGSHTIVAVTPNKAYAETIAI